MSKTNINPTIYDDFVKLQREYLDDSDKSLKTLEKKFYNTLQKHLPQAKDKHLRNFTQTAVKSLIKLDSPDKSYAIKDDYTFTTALQFLVNANMLTRMCSEQFFFREKRPEVTRKLKTFKECFNSGDNRLDEEDSIKLGSIVGTYVISLYPFLVFQASKINKVLFSDESKRQDIIKAFLKWKESESDQDNKELDEKLFRLIEEFELPLRGMNQEQEEIIQENNNIMLDLATAIQESKITTKKAINVADNMKKSAIGKNAEYATFSNRGLYMQEYFNKNNRITLHQFSKDVNKKGHNCLYIACRKGNIDAVNLFLSDKEVDVNKTSLRTNRTPLTKAASKGRHIKVVEALLKNKKVLEGISIKTKQGKTAFSIAIMKGHGEIAAMIFDAASPAKQKQFLKDVKKIGKDNKNSETIKNFYDNASLVPTKSIVKYVVGMVAKHQNLSSGIFGNSKRMMKELTKKFVGEIGEEDATKKITYAQLKKILDNSIVETIHCCGFLKVKKWDIANIDKKAYNVTKSFLPHSEVRRKSVRSGEAVFKGNCELSVLRRLKTKPRNVRAESLDSGILGNSQPR